MVKQLAAIAILASIVVLAAVTCGGGDDEEAPSAAPAAVGTAGPSGGEGTKEQSTTSVDLSQEGDAIDFTIIVSDAVSEGAVTHPYMGAIPQGVPGYIPSELTFSLGQTVNFTLQPDDPTTKHSFTSPSLGISQTVKFGRPVSFTYTFDKTGLFHVFDTVDNQMTGTITAVE